MNQRYHITQKSLRTIPMQIKPSAISGAGQGLFAGQAVRRGQFIGMDFSRAEMVIPEAEVNQDNRYSCERVIEHVCFDTRVAGRDGFDYLNHSTEPNLHYHLGYYFALRDIAEGEELTIDYRWLESPDWGEDKFINDEAGRPLRGHDWREAVMLSCRTLIELLQSEIAAERQEEALKIQVKEKAPTA